MKITRENYEQMAMEFIEGALRPDRKADFEAFLAQHSDIAEEIAALCEHTPTLPPCMDIYPDKEALYKGRILTAQPATKPARRPLRRIIGAAAAVAAIIAVIVLFTVNNDSRHDGEIATGTPSQTSTETAAEITPDTPAKTTTPEPATGIASLEAADSKAEDSATAGARAAGSETAGIADTKETSTGKTSMEEIIVAATVETAGPETQIIIADTEPELIPVLSEDIHIENAEQDMAIAQYDIQPADEVFPEDKHRGGRENRGNLRRTLASFIAPFDELNPIRTYKTENTSGIQIASIRIEKSTEQN